MKGEKQNMNKFLQKVAKLTLGLAMAAGVGVAIYSNNDYALKTDAAYNDGTGAESEWTGSYSGGVITWNIDDRITIRQEQNGAQTAPSSSYVAAPRWYSGNKITITPAANVSLHGLQISATSNNYATALKNSTYTNASASVSNSTVTITSTTATSPITIVMSGQCRITVGTTTKLKYWYTSGGQTYSFTVNYNGNGKDSGTVPSPQTGTGASVTLSNNTLTKAGYLHIGWSVQANLGNSTADYAKGQSVTLTDDWTVTLYAHWMKMASYELVRSLDDLTVGSRYLINAYYSSTDYFMSKEQKDNNRGAVSLEPDANDVVQETADVEVFVLGGDSSNGWMFAPTKGSAASGNVIYAAGGTSGNYLKTGALTTVGDKGRFAITMPDEGYVDLNIIAKDSGTTKNKMCFNYNGGSPIFACYSSAPNTGIDEMYLYKEQILLQSTDTVTLGSSIDLNSNVKSINGSVSYTANLSETLTIASSDTDVAEVQNISHNYASGSSTFSVLGKANGTVTITVTGDTSGVVLSKEVTVSTSLNGLVVPTEDVSVGIEQEYYLYNAISFDPSTTTQRTLVFDIEDGPSGGAEILTGDLFYAIEEGRYEILVMDENFEEYTFYISVVAPFVYDSLEASSSKHYHLGDTFDKNSVTLTAVYVNENEDEQRIPVDASDAALSWTIPGSFATAIGTQYTISVSYTVDAVQKSASINVTLEAISNIEVISSDIPNSIIFGSEAPTVTASVRAYTSSEPSGFVANSSYVSVGTIDTTELGEQSISVTYGGKSASINTYITNVGTNFSTQGCEVSGSGFTNSSLPSGWTKSGTGSYDSETKYKLKFDGDGDYVQYKTDSVLTNSDSITVTISVKKVGGSGESSFTAYALNSSGSIIDTIYGTVGPITGAQNAEKDVSGTIDNPDNTPIYGVRFVFSKASSGNVGVYGASISAESTKDTAMVSAQGNAFVEYLAKFKTCESGWASRNSVKNLVTEYNAMHTDAKSAVGSATITDYDWTKVSEYNLNTHTYTGGVATLSGVIAIDKLKDMVDKYNASLQPGEETLVLQTPSGNFSSYGSSHILLFLNLKNTNTAVIIVIISLVSVSAIGGYFFLRKRKENI